MSRVVDLQEVFDQPYHSTAWLMPAELEAGRVTGRPEIMKRLFHYKQNEPLPDGPCSGAPAQVEHTNLPVPELLCTGADFSIVLIRHARVVAYRLDGAPVDPRVLARTAFGLHVGMKRYMEATLDQLTDEAHGANRARDLERALVGLVKRAEGLAEQYPEHAARRGEFLEVEIAKAAVALDPQALGRIPLGAYPGTQVVGHLTVPTDLDVGSGYAVKVTLDCTARRAVL